MAQDMTKRERWPLEVRFPHPDRARARRRRGASPPRLLRIPKERGFPLRSARSLPSRSCPDLAAIPCRLARAVSVGERRLRDTLLAGSRFSGERSARQLLGRLLLQYRD